jgi:hypothetical protein
MHSHQCSECPSQFVFVAFHYLRHGVFRDTVKKRKRESRRLDRFHTLVRTPASLYGPFRLPHHKQIPWQKAILLSIQCAIHSNTRDENIYFRTLLKSCYELDDRGSIPSKGNNCFSTSSRVLSSGCQVYEPNVRGSVPSKGRELFQCRHFQTTLGPINFPTQWISWTLCAGRPRIESWSHLCSPCSQLASYPVAPAVLVAVWNWLVLSSRMRGALLLCQLCAFTVWYLTNRQLLFSVSV